MKEICLKNDKNLKRSLKFFLLAFLIFLTQAVPLVKSQTFQKNFRLGFVKDFDNPYDFIWLANTKEKNRIESKAIAMFDPSSKGVINIDGRDIKLTRSKYYLPDKNYKVGRGGYQIYKGINTTVRLDYVFTWLCPPKDEQCEVYYYKGVLDINYKGKRRKVNIIAFGGS